DGIRDFHVTGVQTCALPIYTVTWAVTEQATSPPIILTRLPRKGSVLRVHTPALQAARLPAIPCSPDSMPGVNRERISRGEMQSRSEERRVAKKSRYRGVTTQ